MAYNDVTPLTRKSRKHIKATLEEIEIALQLHRGNIVKAAEELRVPSSFLRRKIEGTPRLRDVRHQLKQDEVENAMTKLYELVDERNPTAVTFLLRTLGKEEGFSEKNTLEHELGPNTRSAAALVDAMRKGASQVEENDDVIDVQPNLIEMRQDA